MKRFKDLKFEPHIHEDGQHAIIHFENGYGVSVLFGWVFYSDGRSTYEVGVLKGGQLCYSTPITDDVIGHASKNKVTRIMKKVQQLLPD